MSKVYKSVLAVSWLILGQTAPVAVAQSTKIKTCTTITESGTYFVGQNLTAAGDCLVVAVSNVDIDLGGFTLTGDGTGSGVKPLTTELEVINVRNGTVTNFDDGIDLASLTGGTVAAVRAIRNVDFGIRISGVVTGSFAIENGGVGIFATGHSRVTNNLTRFNGSHGIQAGTSLIAGNTVFRNGGNGIHSLGGNSVVTGNVVNVNDQNGIVAVQAVIRENTFGANGLNGISAACPSSIVGNKVTVGNFGTPPAIFTTGVGCAFADNATD